MRLHTEKHPDFLGFLFVQSNVRATPFATPRWACSPSSWHLDLLKIADRPLFKFAVPIPALRGFLPGFLFQSDGLHIQPLPPHRPPATGWWRRCCSPRSAGLSPQVVDNLYWLGRYAERAEGTARLLTVVDDFAEDNSSTPGRRAPAPPKRCCRRWPR